MNATAGDVFAALYAAHQAGDHWAQTSAQAAAKGLPGRYGQLACLRHVTSLTGCKVTALALLHLSGRKVSWGRAGLALAADAASHYWADRRGWDPPRGLPRLAQACGLAGFWQLGAPRAGHDDNPVLGTGGYAMDQAFHVGCLWAAALITAGKP